ncbi:MAG: ABC transporter ATP-binding protein [Chthoniobacteraceae bacterium]|nr:ABC transporter ATP-binding protein [Chthoniobacteraceae bacterium]
MIGIRIEQLSKYYGPSAALDAVDLRIEPGEIFFLLGPSGCGKTTLLRCLAGFCTPDTGVIRFGDEDVTHLPAHRRRTGMVFQNYALWPHKTVAENVAFGLEELRVGREEIRRRVGEALAAVQMEQTAQRGIHELSGGQQQRIALARALVVRPRCLLLDEPLSNLDAKLRLEMRTEIRRICKEAGLTAVYVTHDQKEALSVADRMAVLRAGRVCQVGTPEAVYRAPVSRFVADFVGETNFLEAEAAGQSGDRLTVSLDGTLFQTETPASGIAAGSPVPLSIRPEAWRITRTGGETAGPNTLRGRIEEAIYLGEVAQYRVSAGRHTLKVTEMNPRRAEAGREIGLSVAPEDVVVFPADA